MSANIQDFKALNPDDEIIALANLLPNGYLWQAKYIKGSKFYDVLNAMAQEFTRISSAQYSLASQFIPSRQMAYVEEWERFLGIPDKCLTTATDIETRKLNIIAKYGYLNLFVRKDYYDLADLYGVVITDFDVSVFGTITITIRSATGELYNNIFDMLYSPVLDPEGAFLFGTFGERFFTCLVECYAPAFVNVVVVADPT